MEIILSLSSILLLLVISVFKLNDYLKLVFAAGLVVAFTLGQPTVLHSPLFIAQCLIMIVFILGVFVEKFKEPILDLLFLAVPSLLLIGLTNLVETFLIINLIVFALYFHSRGSLDRGLLKYAYSFSAALDYLFISLVSARYFHKSTGITFAEVEYHLRESQSLYLLILPIASITIKALAPLFCLSLEKRSQYYRSYVLQGYFLLIPFFVHKSLFVEGLKSQYFAWALVVLLMTLVVFYVRTHKIEKLHLFGLFAAFLSCFVFEANLVILIVFASTVLVYRLAISYLSVSNRELIAVLLGLILSSVYIHLAISNRNLSSVFIALVIFQFLYTLSPILQNESVDKELV